MPQGQQALVPVQDRVRVLQLVGNVVLLVRDRNRQRWNPGGEARIGSIVPLHRRALAVAALFTRPVGSPDRVLHVLPALGIVVLHSNLFAVVHNGRAAQREIHRGHVLGDLIVVFSIAVSVPGTDDMLMTQVGHSPVESTAAICSRNTGAENFSFVSIKSMGICSSSWFVAAWPPGDSLVHPYLPRWATRRGYCWLRSSAAGTLTRSLS